MMASGGWNTIARYAVDDALRTKFRRSAKSRVALIPAPTTWPEIRGRFEVETQIASRAAVG